MHARERSFVIHAGLTERVQEAVDASEEDLGKTTSHKAT